MTPEQFQQFLVANDESTHRSIDKHVNGKIDAMSQLLKEHALLDLKYQEKIDANIAWVVKLILGAVILGLLASIIK